MPVRKAEAVWEGTLQQGKGKVKVESGLFEGQYSFTSRFEEGTGTNPEELIGAAHAGCFSMALAAALGQAGFSPNKISTQAEVTIEKVGDGFAITRIHLETQGEVPGIDQATFLKFAQEAKETCPVSQALRGVGEVTLSARLVS